MILESKIQAKLIKEYEAMGYYVIKLIKTNKNGIFRHDELLKFGFETIVLGKTFDNLKRI